MGRNAKLYKPHKAKKKRSSAHVASSDVLASPSPSPPPSQALTKSRTLSRGDASKQAGSTFRTSDSRNPQLSARKMSGSQSDPKAQIPLQSVPLGTSTKLKSKLWKNLEAKRAREGKREFSTPKEAGIDYLRQWEKKGR